MVEQSCTRVENEYEGNGMSVQHRGGTGIYGLINISESVNEFSSMGARVVVT